MSDGDIDRLLAGEAADIEGQWKRGEELSTPFFKNRPRKEPSLLYNLRMPAGRLEELRQLAERRGVPPSTLMRQWVIERLDQEVVGGESADPRVQQAVRRELDRIGLTADLIETLRLSAADRRLEDLMAALKASVAMAKERRKTTSRKDRTRAS